MGVHSIWFQDARSKQHRTVTTGCVETTSKDESDKMTHHFQSRSSVNIRGCDNSRRAIILAGEQGETQLGDKLGDKLGGKLETSWKTSWETSWETRPERQKRHHRTQVDAPSNMKGDK